MVRDQVNVLGWYNHDNCGDEAYKLAFPQVLRNYDLVFTDKPIKNASAYILGGGDIISPFFLDSLKKINAPKHIMSVTLREGANAKDLKQFDSIRVRDLASLELAKSKGIAASFVPDMTFVLEPNRENGRRIIENHFRIEGNDLYEKIVTVVLNGHLVPGHDGTAMDASRFEKLCYDIAVASDNINASFVFVPFGKRMPWDDRAANAISASRCKFWKKNVVIYDPLSPQETLDVIGASDMLISMRLHSSIFACICGVPFIDILHNHKNKYFLNTIGFKEFAIEYDNIGRRSLIEMSDNVFRRHEEISSFLMQKTQDFKSLVIGAGSSVRIV
jgi:polysaccharide pyruvyl transferase WcaK-like protein